MCKIVRRTVWYADYWAANLGVTRTDATSLMRTRVAMGLVLVSFTTVSFLSLCRLTSSFRLASVQQKLRANAEKVKRLKIVTVQLLLIMELHLTATKCHLRYGITQCYSYHPHKWTHPALTSARQIGTRFTYPRGMEGWGDLGDWLHTETVTHPSNNPAAHGWELNSQSLDHKSDALTTTPTSLQFTHAVSPVYFW